MKRLLSERFSRFAETYEEWAVPQRVSAEVLVGMVRPEGRVLDLGCGTGFVSRIMNGRTGSLGCDISRGMAIFYMERFGPVVIGDAEELPFKSKSFDYVLSNFTLQWTDIRRSVPEILRVSKRGVGIALPVSGSLVETGFPFYPAEEVLSLFWEFEAKWKVMDIEIPFEGWDLVRFFHFTGSAYNPERKKLLTKKEIENLINSIKKPLFRVLFLYARLT